MEEKVMRFTSGILVGITVIFAALYIKLPSIKTWALASEDTEVYSELDMKSEQENINKLELIETEVLNGEDSRRLRLILPEGVTGEEILLYNDYVEQKLLIQMPHTDVHYFEHSPIAGSSNHIEDVSYTQGKNKDVIMITMDQVYEFETTYDETNFYLDFVEPKTIYEYVVVIDAGHGGKDGGAEQVGILEKDIDLAILLELKERLDDCNEDVKVYYTRTDDSNPSYEKRVGLANKAKADLFISVHNNSYEESSSIKGTEVMYSESFEGTFSSQRLAEICMEELTDTLGSIERGILEGDSIFIIKNSEVPIALIEVGFMTNREELKLLNSTAYQEKTAEAIYNAIFRALEEASKTE